AGTDQPAMAFAIFSTLLMVWGRSARRIAASGALAGYAVITRYNYVFLPVAALLVLLASPERRRLTAWYAAGCAILVGPWLAINARLTGSMFASTNYLNIAYGIYGQGDWEHFVARVGPQFHSLVEVLRFNFPYAVARLALHLLTYWWRDAIALLPVGLGVLAPLGMAWGWPRVRELRPVALHFCLAYAVL